MLATCWSHDGASVTHMQVRGEQMRSTVRRSESQPLTCSRIDRYAADRSHAQPSSSSTPTGGAGVRPTLMSSCHSCDCRSIYTAAVPFDGYDYDAKNMINGGLVNENLPYLLLFTLRKNFNGALKRTNPPKITYSRSSFPFRAARVVRSLLAPVRARQRARQHMRTL